MTIPAEAVAVAEACGLTPSSVTSIYSPVVSATRGVWRAEADGKSVVIKILQPKLGAGAWGASLDAGDPFYWRREADFYLSGLPAEQCTSFAPPELLGSSEQPDGSVALCVEDLGRPGDGPWGHDKYEAVATASASMSLATQRLAARDAPWLSQGWLPAYVARRDPDGQRLRDERSLAAVHDFIEQPVLAQLSRLWEQRPFILAALEQLPQSLCHFDLSVKNVFWAYQRPRAIDWAFVGWGPVGSDVAGFAVESALDFQLPPTDLAAVQTRMHAVYIESMLRSGALRRRDLVFALSAVQAVKFAWVLPAIMWSITDGPATFNGVPTEYGRNLWIECLPHLADAAARASSFIDGDKPSPW